MEPRWAPYNSPGDRHSRTTAQQQATSHQPQHDANGSAGWFRDGLESHASRSSLHASARGIPSIGVSHSSSRRGYSFDGDGDTPMEDADPFNNQKYSANPSQAQGPRPSSQYLPTDNTFVARRSPLLQQSPPTQYPGSPPGTHANPYAPFTPLPPSSRASPTRPPMYGSHSFSHRSSPCKLSAVVVVG